MNTTPMIVAVVAEKGGVGKTTLSLTLAVAAVQAGRKVAVLDTDPQSTASKWTDRRDVEMPWVVPTHAARLGAAIEQARANLPTLYFAGNYWQGPSLGACIERATKIAAEIATRARQSN